MINRIVFLLLVLISKISVAQLSPVVDSIPLNDGKKLAADVYIPNGMTQGPVILIQTPYNRLLYRFLGLPLLTGMNLNSSNYIFVIADWRGFYGSSSAAYPGSPSRGKDGYDVVEWISQQTWSNQKIGTWGPSALGRVQFLTAKENPPHLTCICPLVAAPQYSYLEYFPGGVLRTEYVEQLDGLGFGISPVLMQHPLYDLTWAISESVNYYPDSILVPCLMTGGWYDHNVEFMLEFFDGLRAQSPLAVRDKHRLVMGPWSHSGIGKLDQGELSYPNAEQKSDSLAIDFFDYHLRNISNGWDQTQFVQYFQMGDDLWHTDISWSPAPLTSFYFHPDGSLRDYIPVDTTGQLDYTYDPVDPSPTIGGPTLRTDLEQGPYDQKDSVENRNDLAVFTTDTLTQDLVLKGNVIVHLKISSDKTDTDFDVRLTDVYPDGRSMLVCDGTKRMRFRNGNSAADTASMIPGQVYNCVIDLPATAITFLTGHRLRIDVSSSNYPRFNRNMNTGGPMYPGNSMDTLVNAEVATNSIYSNSVLTSFVELPLINYIAGIKESNNENNFQVYPNPFKNELNILMNESKEYRLKIFNTYSQLIYEKIFNRQISINDLRINNGLYFIDVSDKSGERIFNRKIIKRD